MRHGTWWAQALALGLAGSLAVASAAPAQEPEPEVVDPALEVRTHVSGLIQPISLAFLGRDDMLVLEKGSGQVKRVVHGQVRGVVLDLAVNSASERGLLGIALHPKFRRNGWVYLFWSESRTGMDSDAPDGVRLLGNRIDCFE
jgi:aldose sugar dehydrogenase